MSENSFETLNISFKTRNTEKRQKIIKRKKYYVHVHVHVIQLYMTVTHPVQICTRNVVAEGLKDGINIIAMLVVSNGRRSIAILTTTRSMKLTSPSTIKNGSTSCLITKDITSQRKDQPNIHTSVRNATKHFSSFSGRRKCMILGHMFVHALLKPSPCENAC